MTTVGIVAEYNPFHCGHALQLQRLREKYGEDTAFVIAMSGDFVQRGEMATFSKLARAEAAVQCGASLVLELPLPWCLSSAEGFARGGVGLLYNTGVVDALSFGSESGDAAALYQAAEAVEDERFGDVLRSELKKGISFAKARENAVRITAGEQAAAVLTEPNDTLGVEYIRAARHLDWFPEVSPVKREGAGHDKAGSGSDLRRRMAEGENVLPELPAEAASVLAREIREGRGPVLPDRAEHILLPLLRMAKPEAFERAPDTGEGLSNALYSAAGEECTVEAMAMRAKSKRYALSRIRRALLCAALGVESGMNAAVPPYVRVLAMDERGRELLHRMRETCRVPVIVKSAAAREQTPEIAEIFSLGSRAHDLFALTCSSREAKEGGEDYRSTPFVRRSDRNAENSRSV